MTTGVFVYARFGFGLFHPFVEGRFIQVVTTGFTRAWVIGKLMGAEVILPTPLFGRIAVLAIQCVQRVGLAVRLSQF